MMHDQSPLIRRTVALGILALLLIAAANLASAVVAAVDASLAELDDARFRVARLTALASRPPTPAGAAVPADLFVRAPTREAAQAEFLDIVSAAAARAQLPLEAVQPETPDPVNRKAVRASVRASGPETSVLAFIAQLEQGRPAVRLARWRIERLEGQPDSVRIEGTAVAAWEGGTR
jgi:hypothetical protein